MLASPTAGSRGTRVSGGSGRTLLMVAWSAQFAVGEAQLPGKFVESGTLEK